jgi:flagellar biosynthesis/type III secretory pathway protein FliH
MKRTIIVALAILLLLAGCYSEDEIEARAKQAYWEGHSDGTEEGYDEGYEHGRSEATEDAYSEGYKKGFSDGEDSILQWQDENHERYEDGYEYGLEVGYESGYDDGFAEGKKASKSSGTQQKTETPAINYILNKNTKKFHYTWCSSVDDIKASNRWDFTGTRAEVIAKGYVPCKRCNP